MNQDGEGDERFKFVDSEELELSKVVQSLLILSKNSSPMFPAMWSKKICENSGLECNEDVFFNMISNVVDCKVEECVGFIK